MNSVVSLTAAAGIAVHTTGSGSDHVIIGGGGGAAVVNVEASHGGKAAMTVNDGVNLKAGGGVTLTNDGGLGLVVLGAGSRLGGSHGTVSSGTSGSHFNPHPSRVQAGLGGGTATFTGNGNLNIKIGRAHV